MESSVLNQTRNLLESFVVPGRTPQKNRKFSNVMLNDEFTLLVDKESAERSVSELDVTILEKRSGRSARSFGAAIVMSEVDTNRIVCEALSQSQRDVPDIKEIIRIFQRQFEGIKNYEKYNLKRIFCSAELRTWKLLEALCGKNEDHEPSYLKNHFYSERAIVAEMVEANHFVKKISKVVDWLESTFEPFSAAPPTKFCYFENTINDRASGRNPSLSVHLDCQFDNQKLFHNSDLDNVAVFMRFAFELIRQGKIEALPQFAMKYGFGWLPAALEGRKFSHDANFGANVPNGKHAKTGNAHRKLWKRVCTANAANKNVQLYERAIYAVFAGDLDVLLSVAKTPNDKLWSHCKCFLESMQDYQIALYKSEDHSFQKPSLDLAKIFDSISATGNANDDVACKVEHFFNEIQQVIILGKFDNLDTILGDKEWLSNEGEISLLMDRFCALFSIVISKLKSVQKYDDVIQRFCGSLQQLEQIDLVPDFLKYAEKPVAICLQFVVGLKATERDRFLDCCQMKGIDISSVKQELFAHYKQGYSTSGSELDVYSTTPDEEVMIKSLVNLQTEVANEAEFLSHANSLLRLFLGNKRIFPCFKVLEVVPAGIIDSIVQQQRHFSFMNNTLEAAVDLPPKESCLIKEFICLKEAVHLLIEMQTSGKEMSDGDTGEDKQVENCHSGVLSILNFAGGWLVDEFDDELVSESFFTEERTRQMKLLRQLVIPEIVLSAISFFKHENRPMLCEDVLNSLFNSDLADDLIDESLNAINEFCLDALLVQNSNDDELCNLF